MTLIKIAKPEMDYNTDSLLSRIRAMEKELQEKLAQIQSDGGERVVYVTKEADEPEEKPQPELPRALTEEVKAVAQNFRMIADDASAMLRMYLKTARLSVGDNDRLLIVMPDEMGASVVGSGQHKEEIAKLIQEKTGKTMEIEVRKVEEGRRFEDSFVDIEKVVNMDIIVEDE